jgi:hypothetical protein
MMNGKGALIVVGALLVAAVGLGAMLLRLASREETIVYTSTREIESVSADTPTLLHTETATFAMG